MICPVFLSLDEQVSLKQGIPSDSSDQRHLPGWEAAQQVERTLYQTQNQWRGCGTVAWGSPAQPMGSVSLEGQIKATGRGRREQTELSEGPKERKVGATCTRARDPQEHVGSGHTALITTHLMQAAGAHPEPEAGCL